MCYQDTEENIRWRKVIGNSGIFSKRTYSGSESYVVECVVCSKEHHVLNGVTVVLA